MEDSDILAKIQSSSINQQNLELIRARRAHEQEIIKEESLERQKSINTIALQLFYNHCNLNNLPRSRSEAAGIVESCFLSAEVFQDTAWEKIEPFVD